MPWNNEKTQTSVKLVKYCATEVFVVCGNRFLPLRLCDDLADVVAAQNFVRYLSRTFSVPEQKTTPYGSRMNIWEVESLLGDNAKAKKEPRVTFQLKRSKSEAHDSDMDSPSGRDKRTGRKRPGFFPFRSPVSRFQVSRVEEGSHEPAEPLLRRMRRLYHSSGGHSSTTAA